MAEFSPRVWGWSAAGHRRGLRRGVLPTRVGMVRNWLPGGSWRRCSPHACGDGPGFKELFGYLYAFSPRVWGWSGSTPRSLYALRVLPTRVGMVRVNEYCGTGKCRSPHACGDGPRPRLKLACLQWFSPRVWGWSTQEFRVAAQVRVLPTRVGMVRSAARLRRRPRRSPHACGDGPRHVLIGMRRAEFSPRVWGWSVIGPITVHPEFVLPTRVGMVRRRRGKPPR